MSGYLVLLVVMNAVVMLILWKQIMAGKNDFPIFYSNAQMVHEGQASRLYDVEAENNFVHRVYDGDRAPNNHLPYELLIFVPFAYLRFGAAYILWTLLGLGMLVGVAELMRNIRPAESRFWVSFLTILAFFPVWYCLLQGQDSILLLFLFALSFWLWRRGQDDAGGFILALGLFRPQLVLPFLLVTFLAGKWKFVRGFVPGAVLVFLLSLWVVGVRGMAAYVGILISQGTQSSVGTLAEQWQVRPGLMATWRGFLWLSLPAWAPASIRSFLLLSGTFGGVLWGAKMLGDAQDPRSFDLGFAMALATVAFVSFHSFLNDFSLLILPLLIFGAWLAPPGCVPRKSAHLIVTVAFIFFLTPLYIVLLSTGTVGLFVLVELIAVWLMNRMTVGVPNPAPQPRSAEPLSTATV